MMHGAEQAQALLHAILPIDSRTRHAVPQPILLLLPVPSAPTLGAPYSKCCGCASLVADRKWQIHVCAAIISGAVAQMSRNSTHGAGAFTRRPDGEGPIGR